MRLGRSPKLQVLIDEIGQMALDEKGVIYCQWIKFELHLVGWNDLTRSSSLTHSYSIHSVALGLD